MLLREIILCTSASIDAIGIGISYGIRKSKINNISKIIIMFIIYIATFLGVTVGNVLSLFLTNNILKVVGSAILITIGIYIIYENLYNRNKNNGDIQYKFKKVENVNWKEAIYLAISVSVDAFSMGIYASIENVNIFLFPFIMMIIHISFLFFGKFLGQYIVNISKISEIFLKILSGILLILIGAVKLIY